MDERVTQRPPLTPRYWPGWLAVGLLWLLGKTPQRIALGLSRPLGWLMAHTMQRRRRIAERNLERCFPELNARQRTALVAACFQSVGRMVFETAWSWSASERFLHRISRVDGSEELRRARAEGRGVLLITAHFSCLDIGAHIAAFAVGDAGGIYRPLRSPVLEWYQNRSRTRWTECMFRKSELRSAIRYLRSGGVLWYAPDQDFGPDQSLFVPFFGIQTATLKATERLVRLTGCAVVPMFPLYDAGERKYVVRFWPALQDFPSGNALQDLERVNALMEAQVRQAPEQYWWIHRRFKTRPPGEPPFYD
jgi:KDO2-lipid IV(A) lauroyltransferase